MAVVNVEKHYISDGGFSKSMDEDLSTHVDQLRSETDLMLRKKPTRKTKAKKMFMDNSLMILTLVGVIIGFAVGFGMRQVRPSADAILWLEMPGEVFIRLLKLTIVPLIASNVVIVTASLDPKVNGKISLVAFAYIITANVFSSILGLTCSLIIQPGVSGGKLSTEMEAGQIGKLTTTDVFADLILNIFPDNLIGATMFKSQTKYIQETDNAMRSLIEILKNDSSSKNETIRSLELLDKRVVYQAPAVNMIGVLFCAFVFGLAARCAGENGGPFLTFFKSLSDVVVQLMKWFLWITPIGACFMVAGSLAKVTDIAETFSNLGMFIVTVTVGLGIHFIVMNLALLIASRRNPLRLLPKCFKSWLISFVTTSPIVAVPEMYDCCEAYGISPTVYRFVVPFAAALKGDGSAVFVSSAAVFIAQIGGMTLNAGNVTVIGLLTAASMMALPNIPSASIVVIVTVCSSVGIPIKPVALLFSVEWLLDRMRSGSIGLGHPYCTAFTYHVCIKDVRAREHAADAQDKEHPEMEFNKSEV